MGWNGWKNKSTWNVALWINNDAGLYQSVIDFMSDYTGKTPYIDWVDYAGLRSDRTPDNFKFVSQALDYKELDAMLKEDFMGA